ncbi:hypothetical protein WDZ17_10705 [Pseudokineococcus basanitobsidens]|uniref:Integral membrane protein n=1 Tax=Pseudokineococcus basanitobsidens TaxID=1926649 RepID=A0ABU8RKY9_9ACTN
MALRGEGTGTRASRVLERHRGTAPTRRSDRRVALVAVAVLVLATAVSSVLFARGVPLRLSGGPGPLTGELDPAPGLWLLAPLVVGAAAVRWWPQVCRAAPVRVLPLLAGALAALFALALALRRGVDDLSLPLRSQHDYLADTDRAQDVPGLLRTFADRIVQTGDGTEWATHVSSHPPGALLLASLPGRVGLDGAGWLVAVCLVGAALAVAAPLAALRVLGGGAAARRAALVLPLAPAALWSAAALDAAFAGVTAVGVLLLVLAGEPRRGRLVAAAGGGLLLGAALLLSYGLVLAGPLAAAVLLRRGVRAALAPGLVATAGVLAVLGTSWALGFAWWEGLPLVRERMYQGVASERPAAYFVWANLVALGVALGPAAVAGLARLARPALAARASTRPLLLLVLPVAAAVLLADVTGMSKGEVERIWLPFACWLGLAAALLPVRDARWWVGANVVTAVVVGTLVNSPW